MTEWGAAYELAQCRRCGKTGKIPKGARAHGRHVFCSRQCESWYKQDRLWEKREQESARYAAAFWARVELLKTTPLHEIYPGMLGVMEWVQAQRPSACRLEMAG